MFYFFEKKEHIKNFSSVEVSSLLNSKTSKVSKFFFETQTTTSYIIAKERVFVGRKNKVGEIVISRNRHTFMGMFPRIVLKVRVEDHMEGCTLHLKARLALYTTIFFMLFAIGAIVSILILIHKQNITLKNFPFWNIFMLISFLALTLFEIKTTINLVKLIVNKKEIKSSIYV